VPWFELQRAREIGARDRITMQNAPRASSRQCNARILEVRRNPACARTDLIAEIYANRIRGQMVFWGDYLRLCHAPSGLDEAIQRPPSHGTTARCRRVRRRFLRIAKGRTAANQMPAIRVRFSSAKVRRNSREQ